MFSSTIIHLCVALISFASFAPNFSATEVKRSVDGYSGRSRPINILSVVDTESLINDYSYSGRGPSSQDPKNPSVVPDKRVFMITPESWALEGQATAQLVTKGRVGDVVRWFGVSETDNLDTSVIIYRAEFPRPIVDEPQLQILEAPSIESSVHPDPGDHSTRQQQQPPQKHTAVLTTIGTRPGYAKYSISFALYTRDPVASTPRLFGYFKWDPTYISDNVM